MIKDMPTEARAATLPDSVFHRTPLSFAAGTALQAYLPTEEGIEEALRQGHTHVYLDLSQPSDCVASWTRKRVAVVKRQMANTGIRLVCHGDFKLPLASDVKRLAAVAAKEMMREIELASKFEAPLIFHGGIVVEPRHVREARSAGRAHLVINLRQLQAFAASRGVALWMENLSDYGPSHHPHYYQVTTTKECAEVLEQVPGVGFILDVSHMHVNGGDPVAAFSLLHDRIVGMSFSDNRGDRDSHLPLGRGSLDYKGLLSEIARHSWRGLVGFETRGSELAESLTYLNDLAAAR